MIHYTLIPHELVFQDHTKPVSSQSIIQVNGVNLVVEPVTTNQCKVIQVLSTNPYDYLDTSIAPGAIISLSPVIQ